MAMLELFEANAKAEEEARIKAQGKDERMKAAMKLLDIDNDEGSYLPQALSMAANRNTGPRRTPGRPRSSSSSQSPMRQRHNKRNQSGGDGSLSSSLRSNGSYSSNEGGFFTLETDQVTKRFSTKQTNYSKTKKKNDTSAG